MANEIMTIDEVAEYLRVSDRTVYEWAQKGEIPCGKLGTSWRFKRCEIEKWINKKLTAQKIPDVPPMISIKDVLVEKRCKILEHATKVEALKEMVQLLNTAREIGNAGELEQAIFRREQLMSTGIGLGIGLPHARLASVANVAMAVGVSNTPVTDYESLDGDPVSIIVMVAAGISQHAEHIRLLSQISARLKSEEVREALIGADAAENIYRIMVQGTAVHA
jgi:PTS system nitrogen regulatory IIA component